MNGRQIITVPNLSSWTLFVWGLVCSNPYTHLFDKNEHLYAPMAAFWNSELFWGPLFASVGALGLVLSYFGRSTLTTKINFAAFTMFAALYGFGDYSQPGMYIFGSFALANLFIQGAAEWKTTQ